MKKIFNTVAHRATILAAILLAAFSFTLSSCSDDDDDDPKPVTPDQPTLILEQDDWITHDFDEDIYYIWRFKTPYFYLGYIVNSEKLRLDTADWLGEDVQINDIVWENRYNNMKIVESSKTTGTFQYTFEGYLLKCNYKLSDNNKAMDYIIADDNEFPAPIMGTVYAKKSTIIPFGNEWNAWNK